MPEVNPEILTWARETAGLTPEEAAKGLGFRDAQKRTAVERLSAYESGQDDPSRSVLVNMSKQYHRTLVTFYLSRPPKKGDRGTDFRTLPADHSAKDEAILDALIRDVTARQSMVRALMEEQDEAGPLTFVSSCGMADGLTSVLDTLRTLIDVRLRQYRIPHNSWTEFNILRSAAEQVGVFVLLKGNLGTHHTQIGTEVFRGFSIADEIAPFVVINEYDAKTAWSFTLLHEMVHLLLGQTGISGARADSDIEEFCDDVAGRFLLDDDEIRELLLDCAEDVIDLAGQISEFADRRNISRSMVAYRAFRIGEIDRLAHAQLSSLFRQQWLNNRNISRERQRQADGGANYIVTRRHRAGNSLIALAGRMMAAGALTTTKAATVLGVKPHQVQSFM